MALDMYLCPTFISNSKQYSTMEVDSWKWWKLKVGASGKKKVAKPMYTQRNLSENLTTWMNLYASHFDN